LELDIYIFSFQYHNVSLGDGVQGIVEIEIPFYKWNIGKGVFLHVSSYGNASYFALPLLLYNEDIQRVLVHYEYIRVSFADFIFWNPRFQFFADV
jgi:hypothetical protein